MQGYSSKVGFVPVAVGGSSLWADWSNGVGLQGLLIAMSHRAMKAAGPLGKLKGIIWIQVGAVI